jgi:hypothetical protein
MEALALEERERRNRKRALADPEAHPKEPKRAKLDKSALGTINFRILPPQLIVELVVAGLASTSEAELNRAVQVGSAILIG